MLLLFGYNLKIIFSGRNQPLVEGDKNLLGESTGGNFSRWEGMSKVLADEDGGDWENPGGGLRV